MIAAATAGDTIVALSSGALPAAIAIVRTSGPAALEAAERIAGSIDRSRTAFLRTLRDPRDGALIDRAIILSFTAPNTVTGEDIVEYQCHGGKAVVSALIAALISVDGIRGAQPGEFTRRALTNGKIDLTQAEGLAELLEAETEAQRKSALARSQGELRIRLEQWRGEVLACSADAEVAIDYSDEDHGNSAGGVAPTLRRLSREMSEMLDSPRVEKLRDGVRVVIAGPPNSGKSSLFNALAGQDRAIVTAIPGTTRDRIEAPLAMEGVALILVDTAGLRRTEDPVERIGVDIARSEIAEADVLLWLGTVDQPEHPRLLRVATKSDLEARSFGLPVSCLDQSGIPELKSSIAAMAAGITPAASQLALNAREADLLAVCRDALDRAAGADDLVLAAEDLRSARYSIDMISGRAGVDDLLDSLFARYCLGK